MSAVANLLLPVWAYLVGGVFFGFAPAKSPVGATFDTWDSLWRLLVIVAYVCGQMLVVASLAFLLSVSVDNPLGAVGGAVMLVVVLEHPRPDQRPRPVPALPAHALAVLLDRRAWRNR